VKKIYVGNLPFSATEEEVKGLFEEYGSIESINLIMDRDTGRFRGFGFVEMSEDDAANAIKSLDGQDFDGRPLKVNEARDRESQPRSRPRQW
jgi:RNA recognition motif-containing protein